MTFVLQLPTGTLVLLVHVLLYLFYYDSALQYNLVAVADEEAYGWGEGGKGG